MSKLDPTHTISSDMARGEVSFVIAGFGTAEKIKPFLAELDSHALPIAREKRPIYAIGNMRDFVPRVAKRLPRSPTICTGPSVQDCARSRSSTPRRWSSCSTSA